ncbi:cytochrome P450 [Thermomonospora umbrina]|uniref:Cytochrome P450 n=1 Tax=Thermomonospora umbrina TaxID=111806 RepID=A0A3D9SYX6_9ACTN|nr:cytochrome P450 [Thermomonospora umbrina]REF00788.1 hypothetical protein DFJ69_6369 [Thermomonospora umbrina]
MGDSAQCPVSIPVRRSDPLHPPREFAALREGPPIRVLGTHGGEHWLVSRHADVRTVLADPRFSSDDTHPAFPRLIPRRPTPGGLSFLRMDDPEHGRLRRMLTAEFTVRRTNAMRPALLRDVTALLDRMAEQGPPADLVESFALPLPSIVICRLLGVPYEDHDFFQSRSTAALRMTDDRGAGEIAMADLAAYLDDLAARREREPTDDLLGRMALRVGKGELRHEELVAMARLLLIAGHETTANMLGLGVLTLLRHPDQLAALRTDPSLIGRAVEELLRFLTVVQAGAPRVALEPVEVGGTLVAAGEGVILALPSANRDPDHFPDADTLDIARDRGHHVAFGYGAHQCIGQTLARVELEIALVELFARLPTLDLAVDPSELRYKDDMFVYGVNALPIRW